MKKLIIASLLFAASAFAQTFTARSFIVSNTLPNFISAPAPPFTPMLFIVVVGTGLTLNQSYPVSWNAIGASGNTYSSPDGAILNTRPLLATQTCIIGPIYLSLQDAVLQQPPGLAVYIPGAPPVVVPVVDVSNKH